MSIVLLARFIANGALLLDAVQPIARFGATVRGKGNIQSPCLRHTYLSRDWGRPIHLTSMNMEMGGTADIESLGHGNVLCKKGRNASRTSGLLLLSSPALVAVASSRYRN